ncbi:MAG TPA: hypothetical protein VGS20_01230 [Candidatus Acidoferrales bacterium]|nr:hypothetical protein [Candidatus Acidoferrales bacterium]
MALAPETVRCAPADRRPPYRALAAALACIYPAFWLAQFALGSLPGLVRLAAGGELKAVRLSPLGSFILSAPTDPSEMGRVAYSSFRSGMLSTIIVAIVLGAVVLVLTRHRAGLPGGLFAAMLGSLGFERLLRQLWDQSPGVGWFVSAAILLLLWILGLRRVIAVLPLPSTGFGWRLAGALAGFTVPLGVLWLALHWTLGMSLMRRLVWLFVPGLLPACLAALKPLSAAAAKPKLPAWRWVAASAAISATVAAALARAGPPVGRSFNLARAARAQAMVASLPEIPSGAPYAREFFQRGVNFTAEFPDPYASVDALRALDRLAPYGVDAVALVAFGWCSPRRPAVRMNTDINSWESDQGITDLARLAHSRGMKVMLKPQLWVPGGSATNLDFRDAPDREQWFEQYSAFLDHYARLAVEIHADLFTVGVEMARLSRYEADWRRLIAGVRQIYPGPLVYAANFGPDFQNVAFWDALDYIGLDEYYPLPADLSTADLVRRVERVAIEFRRPVLFTEVGFSSFAHPERRPWDLSPRRLSLDDQARCYQAIFQAFYAKPWFAGMYWWNVGTDGAGGSSDGSFSPWGKPAMEVVRNWYLGGNR